MAPSICMAVFESSLHTCELVDQELLSARPFRKRVISTFFCHIKSERRDSGKRGGGKFEFNFGASRGQSVQLLGWFHEVGKIEKACQVQ